MGGRLENGPPPSTYAAQIVNNLENTRPRSSSGHSRVQLRELLKRVLEADRKGILLDEVIDRSFEVNHKLICVIVRACLPLPDPRDPFQTFDDIDEEAQDSLAVIKLTIKRTPEVLWVSSPKEDAHSRPEGLLFIWLIPHLIRLLHHKVSQNVRIGAQGVLEAILNARGRTSKGYQNFKLIRQYVQQCTEDLLSHIESLVVYRISIPSIVQIPTQTTLLNALCHHPILPKISSIVQSEDVEQSIAITTRCLSTLVAWTASRTAARRTRSMEADIDSLERLRRVVLVMQKPCSRGLLEELNIDMMNSACSFLRSFTETRNDSIVQATDLECQLIGHALELLPRALEPSLLATSICWSLEALLSAASEEPRVWKSYQVLNSQVLECIDKNTLRHQPSDLQRALALTAVIFSSDINGAFPELTEFDDLRLRDAFESALQRVRSTPHAPKRARPLHMSLFEASIEDFRKTIGRVLGITETENDSLLINIMRRFPEVPQDQQCNLLSVLARQMCIEAAAASPGQPCETCEDRSSEQYRMSEEYSSTFFDILAAIMKVCQQQKFARPRVAAMLALYPLFAHTSQIDQLDCRASSLAQWALQSLKSSVRDLRIAATRVIPCLTVETLPISFLKSNRIQVLDVLRGLADKGEASLQETCILALSGLARRIQAQEEMNLILLRLIEYLGHSNPFVSNLAYEELQSLSSHSPAAALRLFEPYWRTLAVAIIVDLPKRPQICQQVCDLLGIAVQQFLIMTQPYTIPFLISTKRRDILLRIAAANGPDTSIMSICLEKEQLAAILTSLLLSATSEPDATIQSRLAEASQEFRAIDIQEVFRSDPTRIAFELLKAAGGGDESTQLRAQRGINVLADRIQRKANKKHDAISMFFEESALGIVQLLSEVISQTKGPQPIADRKSCIGAMHQMAITARSHLCNALPQITSCLRSTIEEGTLCNEAFGAWIAIIRALDAEDIESLVDPTFAIVAEHWDSLDSEVQQQAHDMIGNLLKTHATMIRDMVNTIPSLGQIPLLKKYEAEIGRLKAQMDPRHSFQAFAKRCQSENVTIVARALTELHEYLLANQAFLHNSAISEAPDPVLALLVRSLLEICLKFSEGKPDVAANAARCLGKIGCLDYTKIELAKESQEILVLSDFANREDTIDFLLFFLREILVKTFLSTTDTRSQGLLAYAIQELLRNCGFDASNTIRKDVQPNDLYRRWISIPDGVRNTLAPFLTSKYVLEPLAPTPQIVYPIYKPDMSHSIWIRQLVFDLLGKCRGKNASMIFSICRRIVRRQDISISTFLLPYITLNIVAGGTTPLLNEIATEFLGILSRPIELENPTVRENILLCSHNVFKTLDYLSRWVQEKKKEATKFKNLASKGHDLSQEAFNAELSKLFNVEHFLGRIPAKVLSKRALDCRSFARALFHWEDYIREQRLHTVSSNEMEFLYQELQDIYAQIDEPDGIEGISAHMHIITIEQQMLEHRKAGRWTAVQSWYELELNEQPDRADVQLNLLTSLRESGQYDTLLNQICCLKVENDIPPLARPFAVEASWMTGRWTNLEECLCNISPNDLNQFDVGFASALHSLYRGNIDRFSSIVYNLRTDLARGTSSSNIGSLQSCHEIMLKFQALSELEEIAGLPAENPGLISTLDQRLGVVGAFASDKQYLLGVRRAAMQASSCVFTPSDLSSSWLVSAKLARKNNFTHQAFNAVLHATQLGDSSSNIETARLLWKEGHHRKAIQSLEGAIAGNLFQSEEAQTTTDSLTRSTIQGGKPQNPVAARANLLLAKWIDHAGQTQSDKIIKQYRTAVDLHLRSERGHYHLGRHYNKLIESEKVKPPAKQAQTFITGEIAKLVIENYTRSLSMGAKYIHQTLPRILTLWLDLGTDIGRPIDSKYGNDHTFREHVNNQRQKMFSAVMNQIKKYSDRLPAFVFYTAFAQIVARICHPNEKIQNSLVDIVAKVVVAHPQQAMWTLLALTKSRKQEDRAQRGREVWTKVQDGAKKLNSDTQRTEIITMMKQGQKLCDQLLQACNREIGKAGIISLTQDLGFNHAKAMNCRLVIPIEATLTATLPTATENTRHHKAFSKDAVTISAFLDEGLVLNSLIKPKKVKIRGSDGKVYGLLCKPKDDLRKDQRLLEFNSMITRILKKDADCSKRRLYIKTYAVTPLNEECGLLEWVDGLRTKRDILLDLYRAKGVRPDYALIKEVLDEVSKDEKKVSKFRDEVLSKFQPIFHEWFVEQFPEPSAWFEARLRCTRSYAVMSMVGHVLGLGDRHGENILFQEENGGTFHVDFNCLFDKGLTFDIPERVPFRLTHNVIDAFGAYGYEGPFRKSCELTLGILRQHEHTLMTILETFLYDPTTDFIGKKKRAPSIVPDTPEGVLEAIRMKVRGLIPGESIPLSVEGHVELLIQEATDHWNLARMYIGWCAWF